MPTDADDLEAILSAAGATNDAAWAESLDREDARQDALGEAMKAAGRQCKMPSKEEAERMYPPAGKS